MPQNETKKGSWEKIKVHGKSLEGNLEGDSPDRVVYFLHGYAADAENYWNMLSVPTVR